MQKSQRRRSVSSSDAIGGIFQSRQPNSETARSSSGVVLQNRCHSRDPFVECISLIDDETDSESDGTHASREIPIETNAANVEVTSLNCETAAATQGAEANSDGVEK